MEHKSFSVREILGGQAPPGAPATVQGWVRTRRDSKAGISFVHLSDGSSFHLLQVVAPNTLPNYEAEVLHLSAGCAVEATGTVVPSQVKGQSYGMQTGVICVIVREDDAETYLIQHNLDLLKCLREWVALQPSRDL